MRKIDVRSYKIGERDYPVRESLVEVLLSGELHLGAVEVLKRSKIGQKILDAPVEVTLEEADYALLKSAFETVKGFSRADIELIQRVLEAPEIEI